jgi:class 3 adenylate cyclase
MAETRKLAAILAADVAGYGKLTAADEERTLARFRAGSYRLALKTAAAMQRYRHRHVH